MEYEDVYHTSFRFSHHLLLRQSVGEFLQLGDDRAVSLRPSRDVSLLVVVQELGDAGLGGFCCDFLRRRWLDSQRWIELNVRHLFLEKSLTARHG